MSQRAYKITILAVVAVALAGAVIWKTSLRASTPAEREATGGLPALLDFGMGECVTCREMEPIVRELADNYEGRAVIRIIDIREHRDLQAKYRVDVIPTQVFLNDRGNEVFRNVGPMTRDEMIAKLREIGVE